MILDNIKAIIFDFDGTLYNSKGLPLKLATGDIFNIFKIKNCQKTLESLRGKDFKNETKFYNEYYAMLANLCHKSISDIVTWYHEQFMPLMVITLKKYYYKRDGLDMLLAKLRMLGIKIAVLSDYPNIATRMRAIDINTKLFNVIANSFEIGALKPCKRTFTEIAEKLCVDYKECLVIGDREETDGIGAKNANMQFIKIFSPYDKTGVLWQDLVKDIL